MNRLIDWMQKPKIVLLIFPTYPQLHNWFQVHQRDMGSGTIIKKTTNTITFSNGAILYLGHAEKEEDFDKFRGLEYDIVLGGNDYLRSRALMNRL